MMHDATSSASRLEFPPGVQCETGPGRRDSRGGEQVWQATKAPFSGLVYYLHLFPSETTISGFAENKSLESKNLLGKIWKTLLRCC